MTERERRRTTFDDVAELYDRFRPGYPARLVDDVVRLSGIPDGGRILEIGCGTGQATLPFAQRGFAISCIELGANLAAIAKRNLAPFANVKFYQGEFEDWTPADANFDLVIAAQSFHFIDPAIGLPRIAHLLRPDGAIALFGSRPESGDSPLAGRIQEAYARFAPELKDGLSDTPWENQVDATGLFGTVLMTRYRWSAAYDAAEYAGLMETQSPQRMLSPAQLAALLQAIRDAVDEFGGSITIDYVTSLYLARRNAIEAPRSS